MSQIFVCGIRNNFNNNLTTVGSVINTMEVGQVVKVEVLEMTDDNPQNYLGRGYKVRYVGDKRVCLDLGRNWYLKPGDLFLTWQCNIDRAAEIVAGK